MPVYHFHPLPDPDAPPVKVVLFSDAAAGRFALGARFPGGCDAWQGTRYVGASIAAWSILRRPPSFEAAAFSSHFV